MKLLSAKKFPLKVATFVRKSLKNFVIWKHILKASIRKQKLLNVENVTKTFIYSGGYKSMSKYMFRDRKSLANIL